MTLATLAPFVQPGVTFDRVEHRYFFDAAPVLNVTRINREHKISADWTALPISVETLVAKQTLGLAVHAAAHYFDEGDLNVDRLAPEVLPYLEAWVRFRKELDFQPLLLETQLVHPTMRYGGTVDRFGIVWKLQPDGTPAVVDIKTGDPFDAGAGPQTAAYEQLIRAVVPPQFFGLPALRWDAPWPRYSVQLLPTGRYRLDTYTSHKDLQRFNAALSLEASAHPSWRRA